MVFSIVWLLRYLPPAPPPPPPPPKKKEKEKIIEVLTKTFSHETFKWMDVRGTVFVEKFYRLEEKNPKRPYLLDSLLRNYDCVFFHEFSAIVACNLRKAWVWYAVSEIDISYLVFFLHQYDNRHNSLVKGLSIYICLERCVW